MIVLILIPIWLAAWVGISVVVCPFLGFVTGGNAIACAAIVIGGGGIALPVMGFAGFAWYKNQRR